MSRKKILIANRGEIAIRIAQSARILGYEIVCLYTESDKNAHYLKFADECFQLQGESLRETYLNIDQIIKIAKKSTCSLLHPGYGFLSENADLAQATLDSGLIFIGPSPKAIRSMGNKLEARKIVSELQIPLLQSVQGNKDELSQRASSLDFPIIVKAAAGGGGKGMRIVANINDLSEALDSTSREAQASFGDGTLYIEKYLENPRHIEIQILADNHGNVIHLGERECSIQRRHQKIVEESPSTIVDSQLRNKMGEAAKKIASHIGYSNAGTIEFLVDEKKNFYFLEMNTRIQVEHPVTEMVYGIDLVSEQINIANNGKLKIDQNQVINRGHAIECRIYAEDPEAGFRPSPGEITYYREAQGPWIRNDSSIGQSAIVSPQFDPMISKLIVWGPNRQEAVSRMQQALEEMVVHGIANNIQYLWAIMQNEKFIKGQTTTAFCDDNKTRIFDLLKRVKASQENLLPKIAFMISQKLSSRQKNIELISESPWNTLGRWRN